MKAFSIDLINSAKGERKKAVKYLRELGHTVKKRKDETINCNYLLSKYSFENPIYINHDFEYNVCNGSLAEDVLTLPKDWDKLIEYTRKETKTSEKFIKGKWYYIPSDKRLFRFHSIIEHDSLLEPNYKVNELYYSDSIKFNSIIKKYVYNRVGSIFNSNEWEKEAREATEQEILEGLIKIAEKRGFKEGVEYRSIVNKRNYKIKKFNPDIYACDVFSLDSFGSIYRRGKWAEIIPNDKQESKITNSIIQQEGYKFYKDNLQLKNKASMSESFKMGMYRALELLDYKV